MARVRRLIVAAAIAALSIIPSHPSLRRADWASANRGWARGPVWYIMTNSEYRDYRRLDSEADRRDFIRHFWNHRDPLPDTHENELEREFWRRVNVAEGHFGQDVKPGWKTERGKVFIMLGPPDNYDHDSILADTWGASRWVYDLGSMPLQLRQVLQESLGIPTNRRFVKLKVRAEAAGTRAVNNAVPLSSSILRPTDFLPLAEILSRRIPGPDSLRNLGQVMRVPEVLERNRSNVDVTTVFSLVPVQARIDFRPPSEPARDRTTVAVTLGVARADLSGTQVTAPLPSAAILTGYLTSIDDESRSFPLDGSFADDPVTGPATGEAPDHVFQALCQVPPGRYLLDVAYQDADRRIMGSLRDLIDVPAFGDPGLGVTSLILSARLEKIETGNSAAEPLVPFMLGGYRVIPRTTQVYRPADALTVFYEVSGAGRAEGQPHLEISYQFYLEDSGAWLPVGSPFLLIDESDLAQAWSVPLEGMPAGRYRLEVTVTDTIGQATSIRGAFFEISPSAGG